MKTVEDNPYTGSKRLLVVGQMGVPETVTQADFDALPNKDARSSHLERFIADGLDLLDYDLRDCTFMDGTVANSNLKTARSSWAYSRRSVYPGTLMPTDTSSTNHDFVRAIASGQAAAVWTDLANKVRDYTVSWQDGGFELMAAHGLSPQQFRGVLVAGFAGYPRILARARAVVDAAGFAAAKVPPFADWPEAAAVRARLTNPNDRLEAKMLLDGDLSGQGQRHYIYTWEPVAALFTWDSYAGEPWDAWQSVVGQAAS